MTGVCKSVGPRTINGAEDLVIANMEFENGVLGHLFASPGESPERVSYEIFGSKGTIHSTPEVMPREDSPTRQFGDIMFVLTEQAADLPRRQHPPFEPIATRGTDVPTNNFFVNEILHFEECIRTGREPISSGRDNIGTIKIIHGIFESSRTGKPVDLDDL